MDFARRQRLLTETLERQRLQALLVTHLPNVRYLCGFTGSAGVLAVLTGGPAPRFALFTDGRYREQARQEAAGARVVITASPALQEASRWLAKAPPTRVAFEAEHLTAAGRDELQQHFRGLHRRPRLVSTSGVVERMRMVKDREEIAQIRSAVLLGSKLLEPALKAIRPGVTEAEVAAELEYAARRCGAEGMAFATIVAAGARAAMPHARASSQPIPNRGFVILDFGVILAGYCSDMTRTVHVGRPSAADRRLYQAVRDAQQAGGDALRPGVKAAQIDQAVRRILRKAGMEKFFTHSTGHGVGLEIHEPPRLGRKQQTVLKPGMVVTIEPGLYLPGKGGIRIEDVVAVTETGHEVLTPATKELIVL